MKKSNSWFSRSNSKSDITVLQPSEIKVTFESLIGMETAKEEVKDVVEYIKNPTKFDNLGIRPHMHYLLQGSDGVGKSSLVYAVAKSANIRIVVVDCKSFIVSRQKAFKLLKNSFNIANSYNYSVLLLKDFSRLFQINEAFKLSFLSKLIALMKECSNVVVFTTLSCLLTFLNGEYLFDEDAFSKTVDILEPDLKTREELYKLFCKDIPVDEGISFMRLAIDSYGMTPKDIKRIVKDATLLSARKGSETVKREHFDEILSNELLGQKRKKMTEKDRASTAYHEAGHVVAGYFSDPEYKLSKVEIIHRSDSLGITMQENDEDKLSIFKSDYEKRIISLLGGIAAERLIFGENSSGVISDLSAATTCGKLMVASCGMCDEFGIFSVYFESSDDNDSFTILKTTSDNLRDEINTNVRKILAQCYETTFNILKEHRKELEALTQALLEKEIVYGNEIKEIFDHC